MLYHSVRRGPARSLGGSAGRLVGRVSLGRRHRLRTRRREAGLSRWARGLAGVVRGRALGLDQGDPQRTKGSAAQTQCSRDQD